VTALFVLTYVSGPDAVDLAPDHAAAHRERWLGFRDRGDLLLIGPYADGSAAVAVFRSREAAEEFAEDDPFVLHGVVSSWTVHEWQEAVGMPPTPLEAADHLLTTTRSVRRRLDLVRPVDPAVVQDCIRIAVQAPTAGNGQDWRWVVVTDPDLRSAVAEHYRAAGADYLARAASTASDPQTRRVYESASELAGLLDRVPVMVIPCLDRRVDGQPNVVAASGYGSILPATWSLQLALRARGLGSCLTTLHLLREREVGELLGIPDSVMQVALLPVAHLTGGELHPAARPPVERITYWNGWAPS
jgi:nitroreductase/uncharacterized protein YciI